MDKIKICPRCEDYLSEQWIRGRKLQQYCKKCGWVGLTRIPEKQEIKSAKVINANRFNGFYVEIFDKYGHILLSSQSYDDRNKAIERIKRELRYSTYDLHAGPYTAILWPDKVTIVGEIFK
uniref:Uncharacterized protein n=1 Tax=viral metagenome TaxID=1070528 RepID=A0A6M3JIU8_9ZZZZ